MAAGKFDLNDLERRMRGAHRRAEARVVGLRTGRASAHLLDPVVVNVYGAGCRSTRWRPSRRPSRAPSRCRSGTRASVQAVEKAIREANLGLNPIIDGALLRLPIPTLNAERRQELVKLAHKYAEHARVAVRNVRRDGMDLLKKLEKDGKMSEDDHHKNSAKVQELTDKLIKEIDQTLATKEAEIKQGLKPASTAAIAAILGVALLATESPAAE